MRKRSLGWPTPSGSFELESFGLMLHQIAAGHPHQRVTAVSIVSGGPPGASQFGGNLRSDHRFTAGFTDHVRCTISVALIDQSNQSGTASSPSGSKTCRRLSHNESAKLHPLLASDYPRGAPPTSTPSPLDPNNKYFSATLPLEYSMGILDSRSLKPFKR